LFTGQTFTPEQVVQSGISLPPLFSPGAEWSYSNTNTDLLGLVIQQVTGRSLAAVLRDRVFRPLGMRDTSLPSTSALPRPFANGYTLNAFTDRLADGTSYTPTATWAAGGVVSDVRDLLRATRLFGTGRPLLNAASQREREQWVRLPPNSQIQRYGIGLFNFSGWIGHNGGIFGYTTIAWYLPVQHLSLVVSVNSNIHVGKTRPDYAYESASEIGHVITKILTPHHVAPRAVKTGGARVTSLE
jgi:D-alanyl-D-alanine carboxypeptidase